MDDPDTPAECGISSDGGLASSLTPRLGVSECRHPVHFDAVTLGGSLHTKLVRTEALRLPSTCAEQHALAGTCVRTEGRPPSSSKGLSDPRPAGLGDAHGLARDAVQEPRHEVEPGSLRDLDHGQVGAKVAVLVERRRRRGGARGRPRRWAELHEDAVGAEAPRPAVLDAPRQGALHVAADHLARRSRWGGRAGGCSRQMVRGHAPWNSMTAEGTPSPVGARRTLGTAPLPALGTPAFGAGPAPSQRYDRDAARASLPRQPLRSQDRPETRKHGVLCSHGPPHEPLQGSRGRHSSQNLRRQLGRAAYDPIREVSEALEVGDANGDLRLNRRVRVYPRFRQGATTDNTRSLKPFQRRPHLREREAQLESTSQTDTPASVSTTKASGQRDDQAQ